MKKIQVFLILLVIGGSYKCSKTIDPINNFEIEKLEAICKVWGFLKYYHPGLASGTINWDNSLLETLNCIDSIDDKKKLNVILSNLILSCKGNYSISIDTPYLCGDFYKENSFDWLYDTSVISGSNIEILASLYQNKIPYNNYYVTQDYNVGNLYFENEITYSDSTFPSRNLRLLALFRYWNIINYFYPYHDLNEENWEDLLSSYIPQFIDLNDTLSYHLKFLEFTSQINDGHIWTESWPINFYFGIYSPPFQTRSIENKIVISDFYPDSLGKNQNIEIGDQILEINDVPVTEILKGRERLLFVFKPRSFCQKIIRRDINNADRR